MPSAPAGLALEVPCNVYAPGIVRRNLAAIHDGTWSLDDGLLVASDLVTNAIQHSGCADELRLRVEVARHDGNLVISVDHPGLSNEAHAPAKGVRFASGPDMQIVQRLSVRWGTERGVCYRVWAELAGSAVA